MHSSSTTLIAVTTEVNTEMTVLLQFNVLLGKSDHDIHMDVTHTTHLNTIASTEPLDTTPNLGSTQQSIMLYPTTHTIQN